MNNKNKIGILTFHGSHNYGSCLQAYALQTYLSKKYSFFNFEIVNYISSKQRALYLNCFEKKDLKSLYERFFLWAYREAVFKKKVLFNSFICDFLNLSPLISESDRISPENYKAFICGSDQIWNLNAFDFDWIYFLPFKNSLKYSFSPSFGPNQCVFRREDLDKVADLLSSFRKISVRDEFSRDVLRPYKDLPITCDPTFLLSKDEWLCLCAKSKSSMPKEPYILFYDLSRNPNTYKIALSISKCLKMPIYISNVPFPRVIKFLPHFHKQIDTGPIEFLRLLNNATLILTSSFHGCAFSIQLKKDFFAINVGKDNRIKQLLRDSNLSSRAIDIYQHPFDNFRINYSSIDFSRLVQTIDYSKKYLESIILDICKQY